MRTTVTLDPGIAASLRKLAGERQLSFEVVLNEVLRRGLAPRTSGARRESKFIVEPQNSDFRPGIDAGKLNQLADELDTKAFVEKAHGRRRSFETPAPSAVTAGGALARAKRVEAAARIEALALPVAKVSRMKAESAPTPKRSSRRRPAPADGSSTVSKG